MDFKRYIEKAKHFTLGVLLASTTFSCSKGEAKYENQSDDYGLFSDKESVCYDIGGNKVKAKFSMIHVYKSEDMAENNLYQNYFACDIKHINDIHDRQKTYPQKVLLPGGGFAYVETYKDGVLKDNNSLIVIDNEVALLGNEKTYMSNLKRHLQKVEEEKNKIRREIEKNKARTYSRRKRMAKAKDTVNVKSVADTMIVSKKLNLNIAASDSIKPDTISGVKFISGIKKDSLNKDTVNKITALAYRGCR